MQPLPYENAAPVLGYGELTLMPPRSLLAEQAVLASMMLCQKQARFCVSSLVESDFYVTRHRVMFRAACFVVTSGEPLNLITLIDQLRMEGAIDDIGGEIEVMRLHEFTTPASQCPAYVKIVRDKRLKRDLMECGRALTAQAAAEEDGRAECVVQAIQDRLVQIGSAVSSTRPPLSSHDAMIELSQYVDNVRSKPELHGGIQSGFHDLDRILGGFFPGQLIVLAARPKMGKTSLAMNLMLNVTESSVPGFMFSAEMSNRELWLRAVGARSTIGAFNLRSGVIDDGQWSGYAKALAHFAGLPIMIDDTPGIRMDDLERKAISWARDKPRGLIVADYLQLLTAIDRGGQQNREAEVGSLSRGLKRLAGQLRMPIVALAQLNRDLEKRDEKRPKLADIRDSGQIEQDADVVLFLHRPAVYGGESLTAAEIIVAKNRNGPNETAHVEWHGDKTEFVNPEGSVATERNHHEPREREDR